MGKLAIGVMAKYPLPGNVKTRLARDIGQDDALAVYRQLLNGILRVTTALNPTKFLTTVFVDPPAYCDEFRKLHHELMDIYPQAPGDLGARMQHALTALLTLPSPMACLVGADIPEINEETFVTTAELLTTNDVVVGPTTDGGYYLIGLSKIHAPLFTGVAWSTDQVWDCTNDIARSHGLTVGKLPELRDLDMVEDLKHFRNRGVLK